MRSRAATGSWTREQRYVARDLEAVLAGRSRSGWGRRLALGSTLAFGILALGGWLLHGARSAACQLPAPAAQPPSAPASHSIEGRILFDGKPVQALTDLHPSIWLRNERERTVQSATVRYDRGGFSVEGLPEGEFGISVQFDLEPRNPLSYPGDLQAWTSFNTGPGAAASLTVEVQKILHLTKPEDNGKALPRWGEACEGKAAHAGPVEFRWESLGEQVMYEYSISRFTCTYTEHHAVAQGTIGETGVVVDLPRSEPGQYYLLALNARRQGRTIGMLMTHGAEGHGWDYRFRVK